MDTPCGIFDIGDHETGYRYKESGKNFKSEKRTVACICPKCTDQHHVHMQWTGRGVPRKYCHTCRGLVAGLDSAATYESAVCFNTHPKSPRRHF